MRILRLLALAVALLSTTASAQFLMPGERAQDRVNLGSGRAFGTLPVGKGGSGTAVAFTQGSVLFAGAFGTYSQDNAKLFWDDTNFALGIGTATPYTNNGSLPGMSLFLNANSELRGTIFNNNTGSSAKASLSLSTGTTNSNALFYVQDGGTPTAFLTTGAGVTGGLVLNPGAKSTLIGTGAVATNATDGFLYLPGSAGTPSGTPSSFTGRSPVVVDTTNNFLYFYSGGAWNKAGGSAGAVAEIGSCAVASSSATLSFTGITSTYANILFIFENIVPVMNGQAFQIQVGTGSTPTYQTTNYINANFLTPPTTYIGITVGMGTSLSEASIANTAGIGISGFFIYTQPSGTATKLASGSGSQNSTVGSGGFGSFGLNGYWSTTTAVTALRFQFASGNISTGRICAYGITGS